MEELLEVSVVAEDAAAVIATVERVVNQAVGDQARLPSHAYSLYLGESNSKRKNELTPIFPIFTSASSWRKPIKP